MTSTRSILSLLLLTMLLSGCVNAQPQPTQQTVVVHDCISLEPPPPAIAEAIASAAARDANAGHWAIVLEKHYQAIESCQKAR